MLTHGGELGSVPSMRTIKYLSTLLFAGAVILLPNMASATDSNQASYWETDTTTCVKYEGSFDGTGSVTITESVALLIVKGGSVDGGNAVYTNPGPGTYSAPLNAGENVPVVSHWIVCKTIPTTTTSTSLAPPTTVALTVLASTTTSPALTTTIADSTTTLLSQPAATTTSPTPTVAVGTAPVPSINQTLPSTGSESTPIYTALIGLGLLGMGAAALGLTRRKI